MTMSARSWWPSLATPKQLVTGCHALHGGTQNDYVLSNNVLVQKMSPFPLKDMKIEVGTNMTSFTPNYAIDMQPIIGKASWKSRTCKSRAAGPINQIPWIGWTQKENRHRSFFGHCSSEGPGPWKDTNETSCVYSVYINCLVTACSRFLCTFKRVLNVPFAVRWRFANMVSAFKCVSMAWAMAPWLLQYSFGHGNIAI